MKTNRIPVRASPRKMNPLKKVKIRQLPTGVRGLDEILGGGLPELSFNIIAGAPGFRMDFRESLYRIIAALTGAGVTIFTTVENEDTFPSMQFSHYTISFLTKEDRAGGRYTRFRC